MKRSASNNGRYKHGTPRSALILLLLPLFFLVGWFASTLLQPGDRAGGEAGVGGAPASMLDFITPTSFPTTPTPTMSVTTP